MKSKLNRFHIAIVGLLALAMLFPAVRVSAATQPMGDFAGFQLDNGAIAPLHLAATATETVTVYVAERACRLKKVDIYPRAAATGDNTNFTSLQVTVNGVAKGSALTMATGVNLTANTKTNLYAPTTPLALAAGDVVGIIYTKGGTGLLIPDLYVRAVTDFEP